MAFRQTSPVLPHFSLLSQLTCRNSGDTPSTGCPLLTVGLCSKSDIPQAQGWAPGPDRPSSPAGQNSLFAPLPLPKGRSRVFGSRVGFKTCSVDNFLPAFLRGTYKAIVRYYRLLFTLPRTHTVKHTHADTHKVKTFYFFSFCNYSANSFTNTFSLVAISGGKDFIKKPLDKSHQ